MQQQHVIRRVCSSAVRFICAYAARHAAISRAVGLFGNACFVTGACVQLFANDQRFGLWLFLLAAVGMLIDRTVDAMIAIHRRRTGRAVKAG